MAMGDPKLITDQRDDYLIWSKFTKLFKIDKIRYNNLKFTIGNTCRNKRLM